MRPLITLTTDFGPGSSYVAQIKGVLLSRCRELDVIDLTHAIPPQDIRRAALFLADVTPRFPPGTLHLAVVDPGVGTSRRLLYAEIGPARYLAPDNGLLSLLLQRQPATLLITLEDPAYWLAQPSSTFHGRDIIAPVAAHLAQGLAPHKLGPPITDPTLLPWPTVKHQTDVVHGEVLLCDSFGNAITNLTRADLHNFGPPANLTIQIANQTIRGLTTTYGLAQAGQLIALFDSQDRLEIAQVNGSAADQLRITPGQVVAVFHPPTD